MKLTAKRVADSCCSSNIYYELDAPLSAEFVGERYPLDTFYEKRGIVFVSQPEFILSGAIGGNQLRLNVKKKVMTQQVRDEIESKLR